jgi:triosephosphate isomerase
MESAHFFFGTNFKMFQTHADSRNFVRELQGVLDCPHDSQLFLIPPYTSLPGLPDLAHESGIWIGAQNMHDAPLGEYTGEIAAPMLTALGVDLVLLGHAERRYRFGESDDLLRCKVRAALDVGLRVLLCIGETAEEKHYHLEAETVYRQIKIDLFDVEETDLPRLMIAYEPVWSIGEQGQAASIEEVVYTLAHIRGALNERFGAAAQTIPVLYGGSVDLDNCAPYACLEGIDGLFVGRAVRTADGFIKVFQRAYAAWNLQQKH